MMPESLPSYSGFSGGAAGQASNQTAFRHFLAIERRRADRSGRPLLLVLVALRGRQADRIADSTAASIFRGLGETVREVDFVGWLREGVVAGAVLTQGAGVNAGPTQALVAERVMRALRAHVPAILANRLRVRVVRFDPRTTVHRQHETAARASGH